MKKEFYKPEIEAVNTEAIDIIATSSAMLSGTVSGSANYNTQSDGMAGGTIGGNTIFNE